MASKRYVVTLTDAERTQLLALTKKGRVAAWETARNAAKPTVQWQFTVAKARTKLRHLYAVSHGSEPMWSSTRASHA